MYQRTTTVKKLPYGNFFTVVNNKLTRGMTLIDVIVGISIMVIVFLALFGAFRISIELVFSTKAKTGAVSLVTERIEYIRSLPYGAVGTVGGIPSGDIAQVEQVGLNGLTYTLRTVVQYTDAPQDGLDELDENGITADYKTVKVEALWSIRDSSRSTFAVTRIAPIGEESLSGGGTLRVNVLNANVEALQGADVRVINSSASPVVDLTLQTNESGRISIPGAEEASDYEIYVSKDGYSSAQTYGVTGGLPNPSPIHVSVVESQTTTTTFFIDLLGVLRFYTFEPIKEEEFEDLFTDATKLSATATTTVSGGSLVLEEMAPGVYELSGTARSISITPSLLDSWNEITYAHALPTDTTLTIHVYYFNGSDYVLIPDGSLAGNIAGFTTSPIDLSGLSTATYNNLQLEAQLATTDIAATPAVNDWKVSYFVGPTPLPDVDLALHGGKTIGTDGGGLPVYKYDDTFTTNSSGEWSIDPIEWDEYTVSLQDLNDYDISERCPFTIDVNPAEELSVEMMFSPSSQHSLLAYVTDENGVPLQNAAVTLSGPGNGNDSTSTCGQAFLGNLSEDMYTVTVALAGYQTYNDTVDISGGSEFSVSLVPQ